MDTVEPSGSPRKNNATRSMTLANEQIRETLEQDIENLKNNLGTVRELIQTDERFVNVRHFLNRENVDIIESIFEGRMAFDDINSSILSLNNNRIVELYEERFYKYLYDDILAYREQVLVAYPGDPNVLHNLIFTSHNFQSINNCINIFNVKLFEDIVQTFPENLRDDILQEIVEYFN